MVEDQFVLHCIHFLTLENGNGNGNGRGLSRRFSEVVRKSIEKPSIPREPFHTRYLFQSGFGRRKALLASS
jgi:hypothetical protein